MNDDAMVRATACHVAEGGREVEGIWIVAGIGGMWISSAHCYVRQPSSPSRRGSADNKIVDEAADVKIMGLADVTSIIFVSIFMTRGVSWGEDSPR